jgi:hypothetical protein
MTATETEDLRNMTEREIRRAQDIVRAQIPLAYKQGNTQALLKLQEWEMTYADEMCRRMETAC